MNHETMTEITKNPESFISGFDRKWRCFELLSFGVAIIRLLDVVRRKVAVVQNESMT